MLKTTPNFALFKPVNIEGEVGEISIPIIVEVLSTTELPKYYVRQPNNGSLHCKDLDSYTFLYRLRLKVVTSEKATVSDKSNSLTCPRSQSHSTINSKQITRGRS